MFILYVVVYGMKLQRACQWFKNGSGLGVKRLSQNPVDGWMLLAPCMTAAAISVLIRSNCFKENCPTELHRNKYNVSVQSKWKVGAEKEWNKHVALTAGVWTYASLHILILSLNIMKIYAHI